MKNLITVGLMLTFSIIASVALASAKVSHRTPATCSMTDCCSTPCCCCAGMDANGKASTKAETMTAKAADHAKKQANCCSMPCCDGGPCCGMGCCAGK